jgi:hypothetical protein
MPPVGCQYSILSGRAASGKPGPPNAGGGAPQVIPGPDEPQSYVEFGPAIPFCHPVSLGFDPLGFPLGWSAIRPAEGLCGVVPEAISDSDWGSGGDFEIGPFGTPRGNRIPVSTLKGWRPRPLDDGGPTQSSTYLSGPANRIGRQARTRDADSRSPPDLPPDLRASLPSPKPCWRAEAAAHGVMPIG